jgi:ADP-ribose pyrophosphatase YjhB (NUDIX family)
MGDSRLLEGSFMQESAEIECTVHRLVSHVALLHHTSALLVKYSDLEAYDKQTGWFLPNDSLKHVEHPEIGAKRLLKEQVGVEEVTLKLAEIESFIGENKSWHLILDFLAFPTTKDITKGKGVTEAKWFEIGSLPPPQEFAHRGWGRGLLLSNMRNLPTET